MRYPTRRDMLFATAAFTAGAAVSGHIRTAAADAGPAGLSGLSDGTLSFPPEFYLPETPVPDVEALLESNGLPSDIITADCNVALLRDGDNVVLFDVGAGSRFIDTTGRLPDALEAADVAPEDVTHVVFTHAHPDHLWGVLDDFDEPMFPEARHFISRPEWDFWTDPDTLDRMPEEQKSFAVGAKRNLEAIEAVVERFDYDTEILPNVYALDTRGHTPGHTSFEVRAGSGAPFLVVGDAVTHPVIAFQHPEWRFGTDQDPDRAIKTRSMLLDRLASEKLPAIGYHWSQPGIGHVERRNGAYRFVPA